MNRHLHRLAGVAGILAACALLVGAVRAADEPAAATPPAVPSPGTPAKSVQSPADADDNEPDAAAEAAGKIKVQVGGNQGDPEVRIFDNYRLRAGKKAQKGVVVVFGDADIDGDVDGDVVDVGGRVRVNGKVSGDIVNVGAGVKLGPKAVVDGDVVGVLGGVDADDAAKVLGEIRPIGRDWGETPEAIQVFARECVFKLRPVAPSAAIAWVFSGVLLLVYLVLAAIFPHAVNGCARSLHSRPISTFLLGLVALPMAAGVALLLVITVVGTLLVPFLGAGLVVAAIVGKAGFLAFIGQSILRRRDAAVAAPLAVLVGWLLITLFYMIPVLGLIVWQVTAVWGLGAALQAVFSGRRREAGSRPPSTVGPGPRAAAPQGAVAPVISPTPPSSPGPAAAGASPEPAAAASAAPAAGGETRPAESAAALAAPGAALLAATATTATTGPEPGAPAETGAAPSSPASPEALPSPGPESATPVPSPRSDPSSMSSTPSIPLGAAAPERAVPAGRSTLSSAGPTSRPAPGLSGDPASLPRVPFWPRLAVAAADCLIVVFLIHALLFRWIDFDLTRGALFLAYFAGFHVWRGATPMAAVFGHKVVRLDGRPIDLPCALVRALMAGAGAFALFLGFLWCAWDPERQTWHDKLAGTVVVQLPKPEPLV